MNNYYRQYGEPYNPQEYYPNTYSLWQNSQYYDINNLSPQNCASKVWSEPAACGSEDSGAEVVDSKNRRIIGRDSLYQDPDIFYGKLLLQQNQNSEISSQHLGSDWKQLQWHKAGEYKEPAGSDWTQQQCDKDEESTQPVQGSSNQNVQKGSKMHRKLTQALAQPVSLSKAESMMQKMGWQGGALGKTGEGIVEPIAPNAVYATKTIGFGQSQPQRMPKQNDKPVESKEDFNTNVLLHILNFVKNEAEIEIVFDRTLWKEERKRVHGIVNDVINGENKADCDDMSQMDILKQIYNHNCYVLCTQSDGVTPNRQLCVYKEAPSHVYLITPDDLKNNIVETVDVEDKNHTKKNDDEQTDEPSNMDVDESNPFLKSITRNLKEENISTKLEECNIDSSKTDSSTLSKIIEYFTEFWEHDDFTELRFLGAFCSEEIESVNEFLSILYKAMNTNENDMDECREELVKILENGGSFGFYEDVNGSTVIYKVKKDEQPKS